MAKAESWVTPPLVFASKAGHRLDTEPIGRGRNLRGRFRAVAAVEFAILLANSFFPGGLAGGAISSGHFQVL